ncbi:MAG: hypothetical protein ABIJ81_00040 [Patescibacteria group bacterium]
MNDQEGKRVMRETGIHIEDLSIGGNFIDQITESEEVFNQLTEMWVKFNSMICDHKVGILVVEQHIKKMLCLATTKDARLRIVAGIYQMISNQSRYRKFLYTVKCAKPPQISVFVAQRKKELSAFYRGRIFQAVADNMDRYNRTEWIGLCCEAKYYGVSDDEIKNIITVAKKRYQWN